jgi:DNA uptake protein ComE-like DNA-binding protein
VYTQLDKRIVTNFLEGLMKNRFAKVVMIAASLLLSAGLASAVEVKTTAPDAAGAAKSATTKTKASAVAAKESVKGTAAAAKGAAVDAKAGAKAAVVDSKAAAKSAVVDTKAGAKAAVVDSKAGAKAAVVNTKASATAAKDKVKAPAAAAKPGIVDINTASEAELKAIPGLGDAYAAKIIAGRPYANKGQLKSRNILPEQAYEKIKDQIVAKRAKK